MLAGQITAARRLEMIEIPTPEPAEGQILVRLETAAICGSDLPFYLLDREHPSVGTEPGPLAPLLSLHEIVGRVAKSRCAEFREGDRVLSVPYTHLGLGEYFLSEPAFTVPIPDGPSEQLVLSQPLGTVVHACLKLPNLLGLTAVVVGQGPIGLLFTALLRRMGVLRVIAADLLSERLEVALKMGATHTVCGGTVEVAEVVRELTAGRGADLAVEAVGKAETVNEAALLVRRNGTLLAFGVPHRTHYDFAFRDFFFNEGRLINSIGPNVQHDFPIAVELISSGTLDVRPLITHSFRLDQANEAFSFFADRRDGAIKVMLKAG
jgi:threonine dehydrogenase-like Zn-dependent dehydrogenase